MPYRRQIVKEWDGHKHEDLVAAIGPQHLQCLVEMHDGGGEDEILPVEYRRPAPSEILKSLLVSRTYPRRRWSIYRVQLLKCTAWKSAPKNTTGGRVARVRSTICQAPTSANVSRCVGCSVIAQEKRSAFTLRWTLAGWPERKRDNNDCVSCDARAMNRRWLSIESQQTIPCPNTTRSRNVTRNKAINS